MRDWFASFASPTASKVRETRVTGVTNKPKSAKSSVSDSYGEVAPLHGPKVTRVTAIDHVTPVALVTQNSNDRVTDTRARDERAHGRFPCAVTRVTPVTRDDERSGGAVELDVASWCALFEERAAFRQYEAGYKRPEAERLAYSECIEAWCDRYTLPHDPKVCAGCGQPLSVEVLDLPDGARVHWEPECEFTCLVSYGARRIHRAVSALSAAGLHSPPSWTP